MSAAAGAITHDPGLMTEFRSAVRDDLEMLAVLHDAEPDEGLLDKLQDSEFPANLGLKLESERGEEALELMRVALNALPSPPDSAALDELAVDYAEIYLTYKHRASPYESVWIDEEQLERQLPMFQVREHYKRHGLTPAQWRKRADDHLVLELQFVARLFDPTQPPDALSEAAQFMDEHLLRWVMPFATQVASRCATSYFAALALVTAAYCEELRDLLVELLGEPRPSAEEIAARLRPNLRAGSSVPVQFVPGTGPSW